MRGTGAVAIWHNIASEGREAFYNWHGHEHMLERVSIPGFKRGRRYVAIDAPLAFFNVYEAQSLETLKGPGYQDRLNDPTPWTVETVKHFRDVHRALATVKHTAGIGGGGLIATWHYDDTSGSVDEAALWNDVLAPLQSTDGVAGVHFLIADPAASSVETKERQARGGRANVVPTRAILLEGWGDTDRFRTLCDSHISQEHLERCGISSPVQFGLYRLQLTVDSPS